MKHFENGEIQGMPADRCPPVTARDRKERIMVKLPVGIQGFEGLRRDQYLYVDKTEFIYKMVHTGKEYFLSRPRRFGKSLLLSTLRAYWEGKKDLFEGLSIMELESRSCDAWKPHPVFYFDFNGQNYLIDGALETALDIHLRRWEKELGLEGENRSLGERFQDALIEANRQTGLRVVVLVDEYDKPLLDVMENRDLEEHNKAVFKGFFSSLKGFDEYIRFVFITGITKFEKVSIFSDLNQLEDISLDSDYAQICGITEAELTSCFRPQIERMAEEKKISTDDCISRLRRTYDGYRFSSDPGLCVYNPYDLLTALKKRNYGAYWYETGTPTFLLKRLKELHFDVRQLTDGGIFATERALSSFRAEQIDPVPLLYQTGYLTITDYDVTGEYYTLRIPNEEVRYAFMESLMPEYVDGVGPGSGKDILTLRGYMEAGDLSKIMEVLAALFASIPYTTNDAPFEHYFQTVLFIVFTLLDQYVHCEYHTALGRIDCIVETKQFVYLFEFKKDKSAEEALQQINDRNYAASFAADKRKLIKVGVNFDSEKRLLENWKTEES